MSKYRIILSGGGTGGHIYPAIAIANEIRRRYPQSVFLFVGAKNRMEMDKVPQAGYEIVGLPIAGMQRRFTWKSILIPFKLLKSLMMARSIIRNFKPDVIIGTGGYASMPILYAGSFRKMNCFVQEQNYFPGIANRILSKRVKKIFVAYDGMEKFFPKDKIIKTGNPVRQDILSLSSKSEEGKMFFGLDKNKKTLLVIGGSLGAKKINELIESNLSLFKSKSIQIIWQCGDANVQRFVKYDSNEGVQVHAFIKRMDMAYAAADMIISRAGAIAISELVLVGKPVIFIPSPNVAEDHQTKNAQVLVNANAALMIKESEYNIFEKYVLDIIDSEEYRNNFSKRIKKMGMPKATENIVNHIFEV